MAVKLIDELQKEIKAAGEAVKQEAYEKAYDHVFQILDNLEKLLNDNRYLEGNEITEEDKRLYDILIRFDAVYYFKQRLNRKASLAFVCAVVEMTAAGKIIAGRTYRYFEVYVSLAIIYWIITIIVEQGIKLIEKKIRIPENAPAIQTDEGALNQ